MKRVSIQGARGAFHEVAANSYFKDKALVELKAVAQFSELVSDVAQGICDFGVIAIENTLAGTIHQNFQLIVDNNLRIAGEEVLRIKHYLGVYPGAKLTNLTEVRSHYMAINQCRAFFKNMPNIKLVDEVNTALCAQQVMDQKLTQVGAIASKQAMDLYGLDIVAEEIETNKQNFTRFLILQSASSEIEGETNKATFHFTLPNERGILAKILNQLHVVDVNLTKLESLPIIGQPWCYQFFIDMEYDNILQIEMAEKVIKNNTATYQALGRYIKTNKSL